MSKKTQIIERLERIERLLSNPKPELKTPLNFDEACLHLDLSKSALYKLTSAGDIPNLKPNGKKLYFLREELDAWVLRNRSKSQDELEQQAVDHYDKIRRAKR